MKKDALKIVDRQFSFPPKDQEDIKIMKYMEFLEIETHDSPGSPELSYSVLVDPKSIRCNPEFIEFIKDFGYCTTISGNLKNIFSYSFEETTNLLFLIIGENLFPIDKDGYVHLEKLISGNELDFYRAALSDYYGFKIYE